MRCTQCGKDNPSGFVFCSGCGRRLTDAGARREAPRQAAARRPRGARGSHKLFLLVPITLLLVILVCLGILIVRNHRAEEPDFTIIEAVEDTDPLPETIPAPETEAAPEAEPAPVGG